MIAAWVVMLLGCAAPEPEGPPVATTCDWLTQDNCWKQGMTQLAACLPAAEGTFNADHTSCDWPNGATVTSPGPMWPVGSDPQWDLTLIGADGAPCGRYVHDGWVRTISLADGSGLTPWARAELFPDAPSRLELTCPGTADPGVSLDLSTLSTCPPKHQPGESWTDPPSTTFDFALLGNGKIEGVDLLSCGD